MLGFAIACCGFFNPASRLYGQWKLDVDATIDRAARGNEVQAALARAVWKVFSGDVIIEFRDDGTGAFIGDTVIGGTSQECTWTLVEAKDESLILNIPNEETGEARDVEFMLPDEDTIEIAGADGNVAIFRRVTE